MSFVIFQATFSPSFGKIISFALPGVSVTAGWVSLLVSGFVPHVMIQHWVIQ